MKAVEDNDRQVEQTIELLKEFKTNLLPCLYSAKNILTKLKDGELHTAEGISLLQLKNKLFSSYLLDLTQIMDHKLKGESFADKNVLERIVEQRTVLEKMRPVEHKLKYQIDKLMKTLKSGVVDKSDPMNLKPKFDFGSDDDDDDNNDDEDGEEGGKIDLDNPDARPTRTTNDERKDKSVENRKIAAKAGLYVPPRLAQMKFEDEAERKSRVLDRAKKRALNSSIIDELRQEFDDAPEEQTDSLMNQKSKIAKYLKEKTRYEEDNFLRLNLTKKQKAESKKLQTMSTIADDITRFEDISALDMKHPDDLEFGKKSSGKKKGAMAQKGKKGKKNQGSNRFKRKRFG